MSDNRVLELLRAVRADIAQIHLKLDEHSRRLNRIELGVAALRRDAGSDAEHRAEMEIRFDQVLDRLGRVERRLDLADAP